LKENDSIRHAVKKLKAARFTSRASIWETSEHLVDDEQPPTANLSKSYNIEHNNLPIEPDSFAAVLGKS